MWRAFLLSACLLLAAVACEKKGPAAVCGGVTLTAAGAADDDLYLRGSFNNWDRSTPMSYRGGRWEVTLSLPPGDYAYAFYATATDGWSLDPDNPLARYDNGKRYSRLIAPDCRYPRLAVEGRPMTDGSSLTLGVRFIPGVAGAAPDMKKSTFTLNGAAVDPAYDDATRLFTLNATGLKPGKYTALFTVRDTGGFAAPTLFVPLWVEQTPFDWRDAVIYQIMTDRFMNGDSANDGPVAGVDQKANWQGGDLRGIIDKLDAGYFTALGVTALWISSPLANTQKGWKGMGNDDRLYAAYHSYWPVATGWSDLTPVPGLDSPIEPHFGTAADLRELADKAHAKGIRLMLDVVPNHVHEESYFWRTYRYDGWFNSAPDGLPVNALGGYTCGWERPEECWFTDYLPDIDHRNGAALDALIAHLLWLVRTFDIDGLRIDAVRLMNLDLSITLKYFIEREAVTSGIPFYMVGETFTGDTGWAEIGHYLGREKLDGQFDFPLFHHVARSFLIGSERFADMADFLTTHDGRYQRDYHEGAIMATFLGNHDLCRALSTANGEFDGTSQGGATASERVWQDEPQTPAESRPYEFLRMAWVFLFTSPGIPTIYQGDEFGTPGANDPDNRRMMRFGDELNEHQQMTRDLVAKLTAVRAAHPALRRGTRTTVLAGKDIWFYTMSDSDETVLVAFNRGDTLETRTVISTLADGSYTDALSEGVVDVTDGSAEVTLAPRSAAIYTVKK